MSTIKAKNLYVGGSLGTIKVDNAISETDKNAYRSILPAEPLNTFIATPIKIRSIAQQYGQSGNPIGITINQESRTDEYSFAIGANHSNDEDDSIFPTDEEAARVAIAKNKITLDRCKAALEFYAKIERSATSAIKICEAIAMNAKDRKEDDMIIIISK